MATGDITYFRYARHGDVEQEVKPGDTHLPQHHSHYSFLQKMEPKMSVDEILKERHETHGNFADNARISQALKEVFRSSPAWDEMSLVMRESLDAKALKLSRILSGNFTEMDHWKDDIGYSQLVVNSLG